jgi:hypothetical protein
LAKPCAGLPEDDDFLRRDVEWYLTLNDYQKNETENYLQNYTTNYIQDCMDSQDTFPAFNADENNINNIVNDIEMSNVIDGGGVGSGLAPFDDVDSTDVFDVGGMGTDLAFLDNIDLTNDIDDGGIDTDSVPFDDEAVADGTGDYSDAIYDPSSEVDKDG